MLPPDNLLRIFSCWIRPGKTWNRMLGGLQTLSALGICWSLIKKDLLIVIPLPHLIGICPQIRVRISAHETYSNFTFTTALSVRRLLSTSQVQLLPFKSASLWDCVMIVPLPFPLAIHLLNLGYSLFRCQCRRAYRLYQSFVWIWLASLRYHLGSFALLVYPSVYPDTCQWLCLCWFVQCWCHFALSLESLTK